MQTDFMFWTSLDTLKKTNSYDFKKTIDKFKKK